MACWPEEPWPTAYDVEVHSVAVSEIRPHLERLVHQGVLESSEVLELTQNGVTLPVPLGCGIGELPLAASAYVRVLAGWLDSQRRGFDHVDKRCTSP